MRGFYLQLYIPPPNITDSRTNTDWVGRFFLSLPQATTFPISISLSLSPSLSFPLPQCDALCRREAGVSSVYRSSHHLWNFRARPRWKEVLCPRDEECPCVSPQRKGFIWPGIWRHLEKCWADFFRGGGGKLRAFISLGRRGTRPSTGGTQSVCGVELDMFH